MICEVHLWVANVNSKLNFSPLLACLCSFPKTGDPVVFRCGQNGIHVPVALRGSLSSLLFKNYRPRLHSRPMFVESLR